MTFEKLSLPGLRLIRPTEVVDLRGSFVKTYHREVMRKHGIDFEPREEYFTVSRLGVLRGMHFQIPPVAYAKFVRCVRGRIHDVALDLRAGSPTYGRVWSGELGERETAMLYLPPGIAHGFYTLEADSIVVYSVSETHHPASDRGISWDGFGHSWPTRAPILSERDRSFPALADFATPFTYA